MLANIIIIIVLVVLAVLLGWLSTRAWRAKKAWIKWPGGLLSGLLSLLFFAVTAVVLLGYYKLNTVPAAYNVSDVKVAMTQDQIARGERLSHICLDCHTSTGKYPLDGGKEDMLAGGPPFGSIYAPNLTPGGPMKDWSDGEILRAMREGIDKNGHPLMIMPSMAMHSMSDADAQAMIAFLRSQPVVQRDLPERNFSPLGAALIGIGLFPTSAQTPITQPIVAPQTGSSAYGEYLAHAMGCADCHGQNFAGLPAGGLAPSGPNLTTIVPQWQQADFINLFRNGLDPSGRHISDQMPWRNYSASLTESELGDIYSFLHALSPLAMSTQ
jgi:mono/diheme cytochrome c family protein